MEIVYKKSAVKFLRAADMPTRKRIVAAIEDLANGSEHADVKPLKVFDGRFRLRVGQYRVLFRIEHGTVTILLVEDIGARGDIYK